MSAMEETKVIYYIDEEDTPYMMKIMESPSKVTLKDFKAQFNRPYKKFYFAQPTTILGVSVACVSSILETSEIWTNHS